MLSYYIKFKGKSYKIKLQLVEKSIFYAHQEFRLSMSGEWGHSPRRGLEMERLLRAPPQVLQTKIYNVGRSNLHHKT